MSARPQLIEVLQLEQLSSITVDVMAQAMGQNPASAELTQVLVEFTKELMSWDEPPPVAQPFSLPGDTRCAAQGCGANPFASKKRGRDEERRRSEAANSLPFRLYDAASRLDVRAREGCIRRLDRLCASERARREQCPGPPPPET